jgi:cytochrome c553
MLFRPVASFAAAAILAAAALSAAVAGTTPGTRPASKPVAGDTAAAELFETRVRPMLFSRCVQCHGPQRQSGGLRLDTRAGLFAGGGRGPALVPGKPEESRVVRAVSHRDPALRMPPSMPIPAAEAEALQRWVRLGAPWPEYAPSAAGDRAPLWSLQPLSKPQPPAARLPEWRANAVDAFILQRLDRARLAPAPPAGRRELLRRVTFDLTGLPPTPEEVDRFLRDDRPDAYERVVDALLASPRYGERWARYWLDLVRYADTNGYERDGEKPNAWKYRDYVIRSLNDDKPYDRFVTEQLAGDELPGRSEETVTATGFLRLGTWDDEPNDPLQYQYERLDDLVHAAGTAFLGLTVRCARCHDHKFDPIPQKDYYAFAAAFWGGYLQPGDGKLMGGPPPERLGYPVLGFTDRGAEAPALRLLKSGDPRQEGPVVGPGYLSLLPRIDRPVQAPPAGATTTRRRLQLAAWITDRRNPLTARVMVNRLWQHHFGSGLVRTPNNFGRKGELPTHPELLDWLASELQEGGWRLKRLHRLLLLSQTYRMASVHPRQAEYAQQDAGNLLHWRAERRRLDADALRDAVLVTSGRLNPAAGGPGFVPTVNPEALEGLSRKGAEWRPSAPADQRRRTVYLYLKRALIPPLLTVFDFADTTQPLEQRDVTIVAPQALALLNNRFIHDEAGAFALRVAAETGPDPAARAERAWRLALGRSPSPAERAAAVAHLRQTARPTASRPAPDTEGPGRRDGLALWLRADRGITLDERGGVSRWEDQSGRGHHADQPSERARPIRATNGPAGRPVLRLDGAGHFLRLDGQVLTSPQFSVFAVAADRTTGMAHRELFSNWNGAGGNSVSSVFLGTTGPGQVRFSDHFAPAGVLDRPEQPHLLTAITGPEGAAVYQNRIEIARRSTPLADRNLKPPYVVGQQGNIQGEFWNGDLAELLVFDRALSAPEREQVWDALSARWGLAPRPPAPDAALASLCRVLLNTNEFIYVD